MKISVANHALFVTSTWPDDFAVARHGVFQRMRFFMEALSSCFPSTRVLAFVEHSRTLQPGDPARHLANSWGIDAEVRVSRFHRVKAESPVASISAAFNYANPELLGAFAHNEELGALRLAVEEKPSLIFAHRLSSGVALLRLKPLRQPVVCDFDDIEHIKLLRDTLRAPRWFSKYLRLAWLPAFVAAERAVARLSYKSLVCSSNDKHYLERRLLFSNIEVVPNAVQLPPVTTRAESERPTLLFVGTFAYEPNVYAANFLVEDVFPLVRTIRPDARLLVVGKHPDAIRAFRSVPIGVEFLGFVNDLESVYSEAHVVCAPIFSGSGTRVKILEAASYAKAVVSTKIGCEGLPLADAREIRIADTAESFAAACCELLNDRLLRDSIGASARKVIAARFERRKVLDDVRRLVLTAPLAK